MYLCSLGLGPDTFHTATANDRAASSPPYISYEYWRVTNFRDHDHRQLSSSQTCAAPFFLPGYVIRDTLAQLAVLLLAQCPPHRALRRVQMPRP